MNFNRRILIIVILVLFSLFLRELPYLNFLLIGKLWFFYLLLLFLFLPLGIRELFSLLVFLLILSSVLISLNLGNLAELLGIALYFLLWVILILKIVAFVKEP